MCQFLLECVYSIYNNLASIKVVTKKIEIEFVPYSGVTKASGPPQRSP